MARRRTLWLGSGFVLIGVLGACAWSLWFRSKLPPPATADEVYAAVTGTDPEKLTEQERAEWATTVGSVLDRLPPQELDTLLKKTVDDEAWRDRFRALKPEDRRKLREMMTEDQKVAMMTQMVERLKQMPPEERKAFFERSRGPGFGPGPKRGPEGGAQEQQPGGEPQGQKGGRPGPSKERIAQRIASRTPTQRAQIRQVMREMRRLRQQAGVTR